MKQIRFFFVSCLLCITMGAHAFDFSAENNDGVMIYYNIISSTDLTCEVVAKVGFYSGTINIPAGVKYNGKIYSVTSIGVRAFEDCSGLTCITIPNSVTSIGRYAFRNCSGLTNVTIGNSVTSIGDGAFTCSGLTRIEIPSSVTTIGSYPFENCSALTSIKVGSDNTKYDSRDDCNAIIEKSSNTLILGCKNTIIPNSVTSIGFRAFYGCLGLTGIEIPKSVTSIRNFAFANCSGLKSITVNRERPLSIDKQTFEGIDYNNCILYVPKGTSMMYMVAPVWINFMNIREIDTPDPTPTMRADVNGDGVVDVADITEVAKVILGKK